MVLELVDLVVECVEQVEIPLGDVVDQVVDVHADLLVRAACFLRGLRVERLLSGRCLRNGDQPFRSRDEVDLLVVDAILVGDCDGREEHAEDVVAV
ncbi:MAG TPA: hypothetical protein VGU02_02210 [Gaiellaceae bacterium]|nr:hypothetical protein [Gaiellaceae bacterium]